MQIVKNYRLNPAGFPFYYGWFLLLAAITGVIMSIPGQTAGFSAFTDPLLNITGLGRTALSTAYLIGTISSGFILPQMGKLIDRIGSRKIMVVSCLCLSATLLMMSQIERAVGFIGTIIPGVSMQIFYGIYCVIGIFFLRFFGQGMLPLTSNTVVGKWFEKKRGRAVAIMSVANSLAFSAAPAVMAALVSLQGWENAWILTAVIIGCGMSFFAWVVFRDTPEKCGLHVDGENKPSNVVEQSAAEEEITGYALNKAWKTLPFWMLGLVLSIHSMVMTGVTFHIAAIGFQAGISIEKAVAMFIPVSFITIPLSFTASWMSNRIKPYVYILIMAVGEIIAYVSLFFLHKPLGYICTIIGMGIAGGLFGPINTTIVPRIFGRLHLGAINGAIWSMIVIASAIGPFLLSAINDFTGFYSYGVLGFTVLPVIIFIFGFRIRNFISNYNPDP